MSDEHEQLIHVALFQDEIQALQAKALLEENDIQTNLLEPDTGGFGFDIDSAQFELIVKQADVEKAKELLEELEEIGEGEPVPAWTCSCGEEVDEGFGACWSCGSAYPEPTGDGE